MKRFLRKNTVPITLTACIAIFLLGCNSTNQTSKPVKEVVLNDNGGWCWYQDERVVIKNNSLIVASVASKLGTGGENRGGNIEVVTYNLDHQSSPLVNIMHDGLEDDDHNVPALLSLPNDNVLAVYSKHNTDRKIRYRIANASSDFKTWQDEVAMERKDKITYANLMRLSNENNGKGRIYNFYRGINFNPTFDTSDDNGKTWSKGTHFITNKGRPYVKYISNNQDEIHFVTTEQHPRVFDNSIYHGYLKSGKIYRSNGEFVQNLSDGPFQPNLLTKVYQGGKDNVAWTTDLHLDKNGKPFTVFTVQVNDGEKNRHKGQKHGDDMRYFYGRLDKNNKWQVAEIAYAGSRLYDREQDYTGLAALNPQNPSEMVISTNANPKTGKPLISQADHKRHWELFKGVTQDGKSWQWFYLTKNSKQDNLRPIIPISDNKDLLLLWMRGKYVSYTEMDTEIVLSQNPPPLEAVIHSVKPTNKTVKK